MLAEHRDVAGIGADYVGDHSNCCRLPGAVWPEETEDRALTNLETQFPNRHELIESLRDIVECYDVHSSSSAVYPVSFREIAVARARPVSESRESCCP